MEEWIRTTFKTSTLDNGDGTQTDVFEFAYEGEPGRTTIVKAPIALFLAAFGSVPAPPIASALKAVDPNDSMGWHRHFDEWARQGIIAP